MYKKLLTFTVAILMVLCIAQQAQAAPTKALAVFGQPSGDLRLQRTKAAVTEGIDVAINALKASGSGIERSKLTDSQKAEITAQVESNVTWLEGKRQDVQSANDVASALRYARQASERWKEAYTGLKKEVGLMSCDNFEAELNKAKNASAVASSKVIAMKAQGRDTGNIERALAQYNGHVDSATRYVDEARAEFNSISGPNDGRFTSGAKQLASAEREMKNAYSDLKSIYRLLPGNSVSSV